MYKAVLFAPDGAWVTDYAGCRTIAEVQDWLANQGSRWYFYPIVAVIIDHGGYTTATQRIVNAPEEIGWWKGRRIATLSRALRDTDLAAQVLSE